MGRSEESKAQQKIYEKTMTRFVGLKLNRNTDADLITWVESQPNMQGYLKALLRMDMEKSLPELASSSELTE